MHDQLGVGLLHRHFKLAPGEVMLHEGLLCSPRFPKDHGGDHRSIFLPQQWAIRRFGYDSDEPISMSRAFVQDMATYLSGNGLVKNIALSRLNTRYHLLEENAR